MCKFTVLARRYCNHIIPLFDVIFSHAYAVELPPQIADLARKLRKERRERERLENLGISGPVPDTPPNEEAFTAAVAPKTSAAAAAKKTKAVATAAAAAAAAATSSHPKRPGAGYQSAYRTVSPSLDRVVEFASSSTDPGEKVE